MRHSGSPKFAVKTRQAFYLQATGLTRLARRVCQDMIKSPYLARHPYLPVNTAAIKAECERLVARPSIRQSACLACTTMKQFSFKSDAWFFLISGVLRLPDGPKKLKPLKRSMRKNMDCLVEYLSKSCSPTCSVNSCRTRGFIWALVVL